MCIGAKMCLHVGTCANLCRGVSMFVSACTCEKCVHMCKYVKCVCVCECRNVCIGVCMSVGEYTCVCESYVCASV